MGDRKRGSAACLLLGVLLLAPSARASERTLALDPAATRVGFTLGATLHTARGSIALDRGTLRFDPAGGPVSGEIVLDARSAETGLASRDRNMHRDVLESERFPRIVFRPDRLEVLERSADRAQVRLHGALELHGESRPFVLPASLEAKGEHLAIRAGFRVPYVDWGMRDYSTLILRVDRHVDVQLEAEATLAGP